MMRHLNRTPLARAPRVLGVAIALAAPAATSLAQTNNIMITGFWPPTNEMIRPFSTNPALNPSGWTGGNWENRGYNIHSFFPTFPSGGVGQPGSGDFRVDYQAVSEDFWRITSELRPVAIITFSWTGGRAEYANRDWELEARHRNRTSWSSDYIAPFQPTPSPPDPTMEPNGIRYSSLPMAEIRDAVNAANLGPQAYIDDFSTTFGGSFVSEFTGYHGCWYHDLHSDPSDPFWNLAAGHIHVGQNVTVPMGIAATEVTLRTLTTWLDQTIPAPTTALAFLLAAPLASRRRRQPSLGLLE